LRLRPKDLRAHTDRKSGVFVDRSERCKLPCTREILLRLLLCFPGCGPGAIAALPYGTKILFLRPKRCARRPALRKNLFGSLWPCNPLICFVYFSRERVLVRSFFRCAAG